MPSYRYRMPPEWAPHEMTLLTWPDNRETWPGIRLNRVEHVYADILEALTPHENVLLLVANEDAHQAAASMIQNRNIDWNRVRLVRMPTNDVWIRDYGPITLLREELTRQDTDPDAPDSSETGLRDSQQPGKKPERDDGHPAGQQHARQGSPGHRYKVRDMVMCDWGYNAWGGKYPPFDDDNAVPGKLAGLLDYPLVAPGMILEGGSIEVNGAGFLLTTESVLLNPNRNPEMSRSQIEKNLRKYLGVDKILWLRKGLRGDDTDGHIDDLARFVGPRTIVASVSDDPSDPNYEVLRENRDILANATDCKGVPFEVIELPLPSTRIDGTTVDGSEFVPASYANFYIANGCVLVPLYDERYDDQVLKLFRRLFPDRTVKGIPCNDLVWGQGSIHCITQQVAKPRDPR
jgi:agmatine deiminase